MRYSIIDGFRGFFLMFMMVIHLNMVLDTTLGRLNHHYLGWVEDAQGFVFISGFVVGLVYGGILLRRSAEKMDSAMMARIRTIWSHQAALIVLFLLAAFAFASLGIAAPILEPYQSEPAAFTLASLLLVAGSNHMGILPMYIWFMAITPFVLRLFASGHEASVLFVSVLCWMLAQTGLVDLVTQDTQAVLAVAGHPIKLGIFFNIFGWQVLFFGGLWAGFRSAQGRFDLSFLKAPNWTPAAGIALIGVIAFAILNRLVHWDLISEDFSSRFLRLVNRQDFSPIYLINFIVDLFLVTWLLVAGRESGVRAFAVMSDAVRWVVTRPALIFLGQHSLHVFSFHIAVVYTMSVIFNDGPPAEFAGTVVLVLATLSLWLPAYLHARVQATKRKPAAASQDQPA